MNIRFAPATKALFAVACTLGLAAAPAGAQAPQTAAAPAVQAKLFAPNAISTGDYELNAAFSPDGGTLYFTKATPDARMSHMTIVSARIQNGKWGAPEVAPFSGQYSDAAPAFSPDGTKLFFISKRPVGGTMPKEDFDIWMVERKGKDGWSEPVRLDAPINTSGNEYCPGVAANGTLYFAAERPGGKGGLDLYRARFVDGRYTEPENLGDAINSEHAEMDLYVAPDESYLIFASHRPGQGNGDLYISYNRDGRWTPAQNLGDQVNTPAREYAPSVTPNGKFLFWTSDRGFGTEPQAKPLSYKELADKIHGPGNGLGDLYVIDLGGVVPEPPSTGIERAANQ